MISALLTCDAPADPTGWHVSEKMDGVRGIFHGTRLLSRNGHDFKPPAWFTAGLPDCRLDGEIFAGRGMFQTLVSIMQSKGSDWHGLEYWIFDLAEAGTFEERLGRLSALALPPHVHLVAQGPYRPCRPAPQDYRGRRRRPCHTPSRLPLSTWQVRGHCENQNRARP
jgi:hypothetical protein